MCRRFPQLNTRRFLAIILATMLLSAMMVSSLSIPVSAAESGTCGDGLTWSFSAGTLTISGRGEMSHFNEMNLPPWYELRGQILRVSLPEGLKNVSSLAFYECKKLRVVSLPDSVNRVGSYAFANCDQLESVRFGPALARIDEAAFHSCTSLKAMSLPYSLQSLGKQAFYRCESLASVTVPPYLSKMGTSVFAYCKSLVRAEVSARLDSLPEWTFYGCENLTVLLLPETLAAAEDYAFRKCDSLDTVYFAGTADKRQTILASLEEEVPQFSQVGVISNSPPMASTTAGTFIDNGDGSLTQQNTTVKNDEGASYVTVVEHTYQTDNLSEGSYSANMTVTVTDKDAWENVVDTVKDTLKDYTESFSGDSSPADTVGLTVYVQTGGSVDSTLVEEMAGRDVKMTVVSQNGSESRMECEELVIEDLGGVYDYSHTVEEAPSERSESLGTEDCFNVSFKESATINSEILIQLPDIPAHSNAYLYQVETDDTLTRLQATVVDENGNAHFYVGAVDKDTEYLIGVNVPGENTADAVIPDELLGQYANSDSVERLQKVDYVITGRQSSWGLNAAQVTWIMLGVLAACIIVVGTVMYVLNHRRLKQGYIPNVDYDDAGSAV